MRRTAVLGAIALAVPWLVGFASGPADPEATTVCRVEDQRITEASGLVVVPLDGGEGFVTTNDSGDEARVFLLDADCRTVGVTTWADEAVDVEALAPAGDDAVWVGDIGDNQAARDTVRVARVPIGPGERTVSAPTYDLAYPDGPRDAETLAFVPDDAEEYAGRLVVVSKVVFGGEAYVAPARLRSDRVNRLAPIGEVGGLVTDGAFLPDGRLLLRGYGSAAILDWPTLEAEQAFALPQQEQGEAAALDARGRLYLASEGVRAPILRMAVPVLEPTASASASVTPSPSATPSAAAPSASTTPSASARPDDPSLVTQAPQRPVWPWLAAGLASLAAIGVLVLALRPR